MFASRSPRRRLSVLLGTAALGIALGGGLAACGDETSDSASDPAGSTSASPSESPSDGTSGSASADGPACADTWSEGGSLPSSYKGCVDDTGAFVKADALGCSSGQRIVSYDDRFYGVPGGTIHLATESLRKDHDYRAAVLRCRA
jgi:hypothetical protein